MVVISESARVRVVELGAQAAHQHIHRAILRRPVVPAHRARQAVAVDDLAGVAHQQREHLELAARQRHVLPRAVAQPAPRQLQHPAREAQAVRRLRRPRRAAPQQALDAGQQLARVEGLGHVVVGPHLEPNDLVDVVVAAGDQDDADRGVARTQLARQRQPVLARQVDVEQHQVDPALAELPPERLPVAGQQHAVAFLGEVGIHARLRDQIVVERRGGWGWRRGWGTCAGEGGAVAWQWRGRSWILRREGGGACGRIAPASGLFTACPRSATSRRIRSPVCGGTGDLPEHWKSALVEDAPTHPTSSTTLIGALPLWVL